MSTVEDYPDMLYFNEDQWSEALYLDRRPDEHPRFLSVVTTFAEWAETGSLPTFAKDDCGTFHEIQPSLWSTDRADGWFAKCLISPTDTDLPCLSEHCTKPWAPTLPTWSWIFVDKAALTKLLQTTAEVNLLPDRQDTYLSPYIRLMLAVSRELGLTPENQLKKAIIVDALVATGKRPGFPVISRTMAESAATLMREQESQSGSASHHKRRS